MRVKRIKIGIRPPGTIFAEAAEVVGRTEAGKGARTQDEWLYFSKVREMGQVLAEREFPRSTIITTYVTITFMIRSFKDKETEKLFRC